MNIRTKFNWRAFTSLYITFSFIIIVVSGIILYIAPPGRIAKWTYIPILGLEKDQWQTLHTIFTFLFIIANGFHLYFNWNSFLSYLKNKRKQVFRIRLELLSATFLTIGIFCLVLLNAQPFKAVTEFGDSMKNDWSSDSSEPPVPHAEEMTIIELAKTVNKDPQLLISHLNDQGISAEQNSVIKKIAQNYKLSPQDIFEKMQVSGKSSSTHGGTKKGYGRMRLEQICNDKNISLERVLSILKNEGMEATGNNTLKELGQKYNITPIEIVKIIEDTSNKE
jgi:hypothetical protein